MADSMEPSVHTSSAETPRGNGISRGRGRGRGNGRGRGRGDGSQHERGGGYRGGPRGGAFRPVAQHNGAVPEMSPRIGNLSAQVGQAVNGKKAEKDGNENGEGEEEEVCWICASPIIHEAVYPCNHRTCHICSLRMRALYKDKNCAHCRTEGAFVIFTGEKEKRFEDFTNEDITSVDQNIGIKYESNDIQDDTRLLLRYNCPDGDCDVACLGWPDLHRHVRSIHHKKICDLCSRHKKVFTHEHDLFTDQELSKHMKKGDDNPGAVDQTGFKGHPICSFCNTRFYGDDELFIHCREKHERCQLCDSLGGRPPQYFLNYEALYNHFKADHFVCSHPSCLEKKFIAFTSEMDLKAHQLSEHANDLSKDVRRDARIVDMSAFDLRQPYIPDQLQRGGRSQREQRDGRGRGRGRDPNTEALPASSAQPLRRDQEAFQRQMEIVNAQSGNSRTFGGQLTAIAPTPAQAARPTPVPAAVEQVTQAVNNASIADLSPQEQARQLRHQAVIERASRLLGNNNTKIQQFRNSISTFKNNGMNAPALIESFFALFADTTPAALGTLIREVADLYEDKMKSESLKSAWNNWRAINEDYPSLPAASGSGESTIPLNWAVTASASSSSSVANSNTTSKPKSTRVLKLKSSTAQSSRSQLSEARSWGGSSAQTSTQLSSSSAVNSFPSLPPITRPNATSTKVNTMSWTAPPASSSSAPSSAPTSRPASRNVGGGLGGAGRGRDAFPALPPAAKPQSTIFGYGNGRMVRRDMGSSIPAGGSNPWGPPSAGVGEASGGEVVEEDGGDVAKGKKKGNKGKKQVLMGWG